MLQLCTIYFLKLRGFLQNILLEVKRVAGLCKGFSYDWKVRLEARNTYRCWKEDVTVQADPLY